MVVLQWYAAADSSRNTLDQDEFQGGCIGKLKMQVKHQKATNNEAKANLILHNLIRGHKDISDVPLELHSNVKKVLEKHLEEATNTINITTTSSCVSYYEFYYFISIVAYICMLHHLSHTSASYL